MKKIEKLERWEKYSWTKINEIIDVVNAIDDHLFGEPKQTQEPERNEWPCKKCHGSSYCVCAEKEPECEHEWLYASADTNCFEYCCKKCGAVKVEEKPAKKEFVHRPGEIFNFQHKDELAEEIEVLERKVGHLIDLEDISKKDIKIIDRLLARLKESK